MTSSLGFCGVSQRTASFSRLLRKERGTDWLLILTREDPHEANLLVLFILKVFDVKSYRRIFPKRIQISFTQIETKQRITLYNSYHDKIIFYYINVLLVLISPFFSTFQRNVVWFSHAHPPFLIKPYIAYFTDMI